MGTSFHGVTWEMAHMLGVYVWKKVLGWVSLHIGDSLGDLGRGSVYREL